MKMDQIQMLLMTTGMSPDELIQKLAEFKSSGTPITANTIKKEPGSPEVICIDDEDEPTPPPAPLTNGDTVVVKKEIKIEVNGTKEDKSEESNKVNGSKNEDDVILVDDEDDVKKPPCDTNVNSKDIIDLSDEDDDESNDGKEGIEEIIEDNYTYAEPAVSSINDNFESKDGTKISSDDDSAAGTSTLIRLKIASLLEKRFNEEDPPVNEEFSTKQNKLEVVEEKEGDVKVEKRPFIGSIRKKVKKVEDVKEKEDACSEEISVTASLVPDEEMRELIFNQLSRLRQRKSDEEGPLVDIVNPIPQKMFSKKVPKSDNEDDAADGVPADELFVGIKIVDVKGGVKEGDNSFFMTTNKEEEAKKENEKPDDLLAIQKEEKFEVINEDLDSHIIKVTKTDHFERIKGWKNKKLLINKPTKDIQMEMSSNHTEHNLVINIPITKEESEPIAGCSYLRPIEEVKFDITTKPDKVETENKTDSLTDAAINVFASNNLDGFLNQQKNLNISYDVPNLESSEKSVVDLLDSTVLVHDPPTNIRQTDGKRLFTLADDENATCISPAMKSNPYKPRTLAEKRKLLEMSEDSLSHSPPPPPPPLKKYKEDPSYIIGRDKSTLPNDFIYSSVYYRGRHFKVPANYRKVIYIDMNNKGKKRKRKLKTVPTKPPTILNDSTKKPSIYASVVKHETVRYKPGPLSKKHVLQTDSTNWTTVLKELPTISVEVKPEFGKRIHPIARQFVNFDEYDISPERAEFAVTAVKSEGSDDGKSYTFDAHYANNVQKMILLKSVKKELKKEVKVEENVAPPVSVVNESPEEIQLALNQIVDDMLTYVERKEIGESILKDDDYHPEISDEDYIAADKKRGRRAEVIKGKSKKTNMELKRLNVKVIEVNIEEDLEPIICTKSFCKLGCVCKSLTSTPLPNDHCRQATCIFDCKCGFAKSRKDTLKFIVPPGTDILSDRTVSRLQDAAKKDLAKVEAEFTQTVIHAYNQTIVVGDSTERKRRPLKLPKKYRDYFKTNTLYTSDKSDDEDFIIKTVEESEPNSPAEIVPEAETTKLEEIVESEPELRLVLDKIDLAHAIPLCLTHHVYNCDCSYVLALPKIQVKPFVKLSSESTETPDNERSSPEPDIWTPTGPKKYKVKKWTHVKKRGQHLGKNAKVDPGDCARTKGLATDYYLARNKTMTFRKKLAKKIKRDIVGNNLAGWFNKTTFIIDDDDDDDKSMDDNKKSKDKDKLKGDGKKDKPNGSDEAQDPFLAPMAVESIEDNATKGSNRRKQKLQVRDDVIKPAEPAIQRRKKAATKKAVEQLNISTDTLEPFTGEKKRFSELTGCSNVKFRLLPWHSLLEKYLDGALHIWYHVSETNKYKFMITNTENSPFPNYENINKFENVADKTEIPGDFIRWVMLREMPEDKKDPGGGMYIILKISINCYEICGVCMRRPPSDKEVESQSTLKNKNVTLHDTKYQVSFNYALYPTRNLFPFISNNVRKLSPGYDEVLKAHLPETDNLCKWRVIKLQPEIVMIGLTRNEFSIKCSDLRSIMSVAVSHKKTIIINNDTVTVKYPHKQFGIYLSPNYEDHVFIGPYFKYEEHDLKTMRMVNDALISSELLNTPNITDTGYWYQQTTPTVESRIQPAVIDLTDNDETADEENTKKKLSKIEKNDKQMDAELWKKYDFLNKKYNTLSLKDKDFSKQRKELQRIAKVLGKKEELVKLKEKPSSNSSASNSSTSESEKQTYTLDVVFASRIRAVIKNLSLIIPDDSIPLCFKVNFDKGLIYGYKNTKKQQVTVYWPGDTSSTSSRVFKNEEVAKDWLQKELNNFFILVPSTYHIEVNLMQEDEYRDAISRAPLNAKYFKEVYIIGHFGAMYLPDIADELIKYHEVDENGEAVDPIGPTSFNGALKQYHRGGEKQVATVLEKAVVTMDAKDKKAFALEISEFMTLLNITNFTFIINSHQGPPTFFKSSQDHIMKVLVKEKNLISLKKALDAKKKALLLKHTQLIKQVSNKTSEIIKKEFMQKWNFKEPTPPQTPLQIVISSKTKTTPIVLANSPPSLKPVPEIICLDSDEENDDPPPKLQSEVETTKEDDEDSVMLLDYNNPNNLYKRRSSTEIIPIIKNSKPPVPEVPASSTTEILPVVKKLKSILPNSPKFTLQPGQSLLKTTRTTLKVNIPTTSKPATSILKPQSVLKPKPAVVIEKIDVSHLRKDQVLSYLGKSKKCESRIDVSPKDIARLMVLSETNPNKTESKSDEGDATSKPL